MSFSRFLLLSTAALLASCASGTIAELKDVKVDLKDEKVEGGLDKAMQNYQRYLEQAPKSEMTPESIIRLADLKLKKEFDFTLNEPVPGNADVGNEKSLKSGVNADESYKDFEKRTTGGIEAKSPQATKSSPRGTSADMQTEGTREAISLYKKLLSDYPKYEFNDHALYQLARTYEELGDIDEAMKMMNRLVKDYPHSLRVNEVQFRRGEYFYTHKQFLDAEDAYKAVVAAGADSSYYELSLYKLGWAYYKQELYVEALHQFVRLLDHKAAAGYDLEQTTYSFDEKRIEDTYRVMSLSFSNLGGADSVAVYFNTYGKRTFETSVYKNLGDDYLEKRRYSDAAATYKAFVKNNPYHKMSPYFELWAIDSYKKGGFSRLVIDSKKEFVINYGSKSAYWEHFKKADFKEVTAYVRDSLKELATFYHAQYQDKNLIKSRDENFREAMQWYREYLDSTKYDDSTLAMHSQLAELMLENKWYGQAAVEYEKLAYDYPAHNKSATAGYTAVYAYRESLVSAVQEDKKRVKQDVIRSSLKFSETFPKSEKAALVMSAALDDIYEAKDYHLAVVTSKKLLARFAGADKGIRRNAWVVYAHSSFELGNFKDAEEGYLTALGMPAKNDTSRAGVIENLAASFYKQGEHANKQGDYRSAANYFLLVGTNTPTAKIRPVADFDAATALIQLKAWDEVASSVRSFRINFPKHPLQLDLTKKLAIAYKQADKHSLAAVEYERIAAETTDLAVKREALVFSGELYTKAGELDNAYRVYRHYVSDFPKPLEFALEIRNKIAMYLKTRDTMEYVSELKTIIEDDVNAGSERTSRTRYLGATASLELADLTVKQFAEIKLVKPIEKNLIKKKDTMRLVKEQLEKIFDYEMDEATAAATYYLAEMYFNFSRILIESERPDDLTVLEKEQYELSIEEQAFTFEEKSIQVHEKNMELMTRGIFNSWIQKSIVQLAKRMPARYAKVEESSGYIEEIDNVSYASLFETKRVNPESSAVPPSLQPVGVHSNKQAVTVSPEVRADFLAAVQAIKSVAYFKAIKLLNKVIEQEPNISVPYINLALVHEKMRNLTQAEESLAQAIKIDPENPVANNEYALLYRRTGRFTEARQTYEKVLEKYPGFKMAHKNLGILCDLYMKDYECALKHYTIYTGLVPNDGVVRIWVASIRGG